MRYKIILVLIALIFFNGLNNLRELSDLAVVSAIGVDKENDTYIITAQINNTSKKESSNGSDTSSSQDIVVYESRYTTVQHALRNMILESPKRLYLAHMELLVISEKVAREDFLSSIDFFIRDNEGSNDFMAVITRNTTPKDVLTAITPLESNPTTNIKDSIEVTYKYQGTTTNKTLNEGLYDLLKTGEDLTVATVTLEENTKDDNEESSEGSKIEQNVKLKVSDLAYFTGDKMAGYIKPDDNISYNIMQNEVEEYILTLNEHPDDRFVAEIIDNKTKLTPKYEDGKFIVNADITCKANITEIGTAVRIETSGELERYQNLMAEHIKFKLEEYIKDCQTLYKSDILGYGNLFYKKLNKEYKKVQDNFLTDYFPNVITNINVKVKIPNEGGIVKKW